ncbi:hypothetical protein PQG02_12650 [Nostoc sp. UHCC 0926]|uniref:hypothetical protein n=1 Tax=unclassified Nostoc TaxID=2593658 RepID=UPI00235E5C6D|nr:hypothetical protein [Nostoc sp. UHCC 0926]WDD35108.1 hypothetical protein PQG02_12650 [Nostoc sp. UHCC 0926]
MQQEWLAGRQSLMGSYCGGRVPQHKGGSAPLRLPNLYPYGEASYAQRLPLREATVVKWHGNPL